MITREEVIQVYQKMLFRTPESEQVIALHQGGHETAAALEHSIRMSEEYKSHRLSSKTLRKFGAPRSNANRDITPENLDWFVEQSDSLGPPSSPKVEEFWRGMVYRPQVSVNERLDPFSDKYAVQQIAVYREISGREVNQKINEQTNFMVDGHVTAANPYANFPPRDVAMHVLRIARAIECSSLEAGAHVLDMGCGWGTSCELMAFMGLRVTGLDINPDFVELVNRRAERIGHKVNAILGSFTEIPGDTAYDAALFYESLHHAIRPWEVLVAVRDRLRVGGKLLLAGEPINDIWKNWGIRTDPLSVYCIRKFGWFESGWSARFLTTCVEQCGFEIDHFAAEPGSVGWVMVAHKLN